MVSTTRPNRVHAATCEEGLVSAETLGRLRAVQPLKRGRTEARALAGDQNALFKAPCGPAPVSRVLSLLEGPTIKSYPFEEMLQGRAPKMFPVAALVPYDAYYCHFTSISKEIATSDLLKEWGTSLLRMLTVSVRDSDLPYKYQEPLCVGVSVRCSISR